MSGAKHDSGKPMMDLLDYEHIVKMAEVLTFGAQKYNKHNWRLGIPTSRLFAATQRHLAAFAQNIDTDEESGLLHLHHAAVDIMMLYCMLRDNPELDDRYRKEIKK